MSGRENAAVVLSDAAAGMRHSERCNPVVLARARPLVLCNTSSP